MRATSLLAFGYYLLPSLNKGFTYLLTRENKNNAQERKAKYDVRAFMYN